MVSLLGKIKEKKVRPVLILRHLTLLLLVLVVIFIGINIISRSEKEARVSLKEEGLEEQKVEQREEVVHLEDEKGILVLESKADRQYLGEDGYYHLEGDVRIKFLKRAQGEDVIINGDEVLHDREENRFILQGNAGIKFKDLVVESTYLEYESKKHVIRTNKGVTFSSERIKGQGQNMTCWEIDKEIKIQENVQLELIQDPEKAESIHVSGDEMFYTHKWGNGYVEGRVSLESGGSTVKTDRLEFYLPPEKEFLRSLRMKGNVKSDLVFSSQSQENGKKHKYRAEAEEVFVRFINYLDIPETIAAKGNCLVRPLQSDFGFNRIQSNMFFIGFTREGKIKEFTGSENVQIEAESEQGPRHIKGKKFVLDSENELITVFGDETRRSEISSEDYKISAEEITSHLNNKDLNAEGEISGLFSSAEKQNVSIGMFSGSQPVFISADKMRYLSEQNRFVFKEEVKLWQEQDILSTDELFIQREEGGLSAQNGVQTVFHYENKEGERVKIEISSKKMKFNPEENMILYQKECLMGVQDVRLRAEFISVQMGGDESEMEELTANQSVVIERGVYQGRGEKAVYAFDQEAIVLTGSPVLTERNRGETKGDKLTFNISDDKIIIENRGDERSVTVIKK